MRSCARGAVSALAGPSFTRRGSRRAAKRGGRSDLADQEDEQESSDNQQHPVYAPPPHPTHDASGVGVALRRDPHRHIVAPPVPGSRRRRQCAERKVLADLEPRVELLRRPAVHPDLGSLARLPRRTSTAPRHSQDRSPGKRARISSGDEVVIEVFVAFLAPRRKTCSMTGPQPSAFKCRANRFNKTHRELLASFHIER